MHMFFNSKDKVKINFIKNLCASQLLLKKLTHVTFIDYVGGDSSNPVWRKTLSGNNIVMVGISTNVSIVGLVHTASTYLWLSDLSIVTGPMMSA
jgi:hypothetical protein